MKKILFVFLLLFNIASGQTLEGQKVYLDSLFKETINAESPYYRIVEDENTDKEEYRFKIFYKSGKVYMEGNSRSKKSLLPNGLIITYFENGNKKEEYFTEKGTTTGIQTTWYENGLKKYIK